MLTIEHLRAQLAQLTDHSLSEAVLELRHEGLVLSQRTPFTREHFNACFADVQALLRRAGYLRGLDVLGYQGRLYALYDPERWQAMQVMRWLKVLDERNTRQRARACRGGLKVRG